MTLTHSNNMDNIEPRRIFAAMSKTFIGGVVFLYAAMSFSLIAAHVTGNTGAVVYLSINGAIVSLILAITAFGMAATFFFMPFAMIVVKAIKNYTRNEDS